MLSERPKGAVICLSNVHEPQKDGMTLEEIGQQMGLTRERVRQIEKKSLDKLKKICETNPRWMNIYKLYFDK